MAFDQQERKTNLLDLKYIRIPSVTVIVWYTFLPLQAVTLADIDPTILNSDAFLTFVPQLQNVDTTKDVSFAKL